MTKQEKQKEKAVELLGQMEIYKPYIDEFKRNDSVCYFEHYAGFWVWQNEDAYKKMKEIESIYKCKVYAITHEFAEFGELYTFLIVTAYPSEWKTLVRSKNNEHTAFAYVWNKSDEWCSEFGSVTVKSLAGGIKRIY